MKLTKMSLVAALLVGSSAFAIDNVKVGGNANLFYETNDNSGNGDLFDKATSTGQASLKIGATADLSDTVSAGVSYTALTTLGLEGQLVNNVWDGTNGTTDYSWYDQAYLVAKKGNSTAVIGRQLLDTPLVFSETWSVATNTFEAAVLVNEDLPDTTVVAAYVGAQNGGTVLAPVVIAPVNANGTSNFSQFYNGAYTVGLINKSIKDVTAQLWYYNATQVLTAYWLQADAAVAGVEVGFQYTGQDASSFNTTFEAQSAMAVKVGYSANALSAYLAYSAVDDAAGLGNVGANLAASGQSKLYTEAWWNYGYVSAQDTTTISLGVEYAAKDLADFGLYYTMADNGAVADNGDLSEITLTAAKSYGNLDTTLAVVNYEADGADATTSVQVYLTYNF